MCPNLVLLNMTTPELKRRGECLLRRGVELPLKLRVDLENWVRTAEDRLLDATAHGSEPDPEPAPDTKNQESTRST